MSPLYLRLKRPPLGPKATPLELFLCVRRLIKGRRKTDKLNESNYYIYTYTALTKTYLLPLNY